jgi:hypothetical protein
MMPLMTRRSSTRATPRTSLGKCGSIRAHCASLSQNKCLLIGFFPRYESMPYRGRTEINEF